MSAVSFLIKSTQYPWLVWSCKEFQTNLQSLQSALGIWDHYLQYYFTSSSNSSNSSDRFSGDIEDCPSKSSSLASETFPPKASIILLVTSLVEFMSLKPDIS